MADIFQEDRSSVDECNFTEDETKDSDSDISMNEETECSDKIDGSEELLRNPKVVNLEKFAESDVIYNRQNVARNILSTLHSVVDNQNEVSAVISVMCKLLDDDDPTVKADLIEHLPHIAAFCHEHCHYLGSVIDQQIVPVIVNCLTDVNNQVRKASQTSLLMILKQGLINQEKLNEWICPLIAQLTEVQNMEELRSEAVAMLCKMAPILGKEITEHHFLHCFRNLCSDGSFHARKICASNFGEFCAVVGQETTIDYLLSRFYHLCEDSVWGVRKSCAEVFTTVSCVCSMEVRKNDLAPLYLNLLCDNSRWVKMAAFQSLGPFISTFADNKQEFPYSDTIYNLLSGKKELNNNSLKAKDNEIAIQNKIDSSEEKVSSDIENVSSHSLDSKESLTSSEKLDSNKDKGAINEYSGTNVYFTSELISEYTKNEFRVQNKNNLDTFLQSSQNTEEASEANSNTFENFSSCDNSIASQKTNGENIEKKECFSDMPLTVTAKNGHLHVHIDNESAFNNFQYWRIPVPDVEVDIDIENGKATNIHIRASVKDDKTQHTCASDLNLSLMSQMDSTSADETNITNSEHPDSSKVFIQSACINSSNVQSTNDQIGQKQILSSSLNEAALTLLHGDLIDIKTSRMNLYSSDVESLIQPLFQPTYIEISSDLYLSPQEQDVIPCELLQHYLSMTNSPQVQALDPEITHHCAYSLPAVAFTLGKKYWPCLKETFEALASDMQWKVRRTLAASIHELAFILGTELTARDLLPVFVSFLRDLDEVRIGIVQNLFQFIRWIQPLKRRDFLPQLNELLKLDNDKNWRFRLTLAEQLISLTNLYSPIDVKEYLIPITLILVRDKVCAVRRVAIRAIAVMLKRLQQSSNAELQRNLLIELEKKFKCGSKWVLRQTYALLCQDIAQENSLPKDQYIQEIVPHLFTLSWDSVPNVRLAIARCLTETLLPLDYFPEIQVAHYELLSQVMYSLQKDRDRDVRYFACRSPELFNATLEELSSV
ncbi:serine/threonine-protein phosphatase 4 regulatory subunit 1-like isoform X2 [Centruroides vittatus]|uniref:serine/threonine-protein phosphatase 4 regulatory subunit 1-like isoform X2 n=1 Tax=Centruroides vittatus TaxID=120091 RepID=UPI00350FE6DA